MIFADIMDGVTQLITFTVNALEFIVSGVVNSTVDTPHLYKDSIDIMGAKLKAELFYYEVLKWKSW